MEEDDTATSERLLFDATLKDSSELKHILSVTEGVSQTNLLFNCFKSNQWREYLEIN